MARERVAVIGGGIGSLAAVWGITSVPGWEQRYEITVYQMGWRLGGKGASGRNPHVAQRIEEHGLHIWGGFYDNAFRVMRECYAELDRPADHPLATWDQAFLPQDNIQFQEHVGGQWKAWPVKWPRNARTPGDGHAIPSPAQLIAKVLMLSLHGIEVTGKFDGKRGLVARLLRATTRSTRALAGENGWKRLPAQVQLLGLVERLRARLALEPTARLDHDDLARRQFYLLDLGLALVKGAVMDGVLLRGFEVIDDYEVYAWFRRWGATEYTLRSVGLRAVCDYVFGYYRGRPEQPNLAAGTAILGVLRLTLGYSGAFFYEMQGGMGDVVFTPLYEALKARGVNFEFFHRAERIEPTADGLNVGRIVMDVQAQTKSGGAYQPLVDVLGMGCWPSEPLWDQLVQGASLQAAGAHLETRCDPHRGVERVLELGRDFDRVVLGASVAEHKQLCAPLLAINRRYRQMVYGLHTTATQAAQLWIRPNPEQAGAPNPPIISTGYAKPFDTWADMTFLLPKEDWSPTGDEPGFLVYLCSSFEDESPSFDDADKGRWAREQAAVKAGALRWIKEEAGYLWPGLANPEDPRGIDPAHLVGGLDGQYYRANIDPTERYVASAPGTTRLRLEAHDTGFANLTFTGDWVYTSLSAGCIESSVMAGLHAAEAVTGAKLPITARYTKRRAASQPEAATVARAPL